MAKIWDTTVRAPSGWWVIDDMSKAKVESNSYRNLKHTIITHRKANNLEWLDKEVEDMIHRQVCAREGNDYCREVNSKSKFTVKRNASSIWGPGKWAELHHMAITDQFNPAWYSQWVKTLPNAGCGCRKHWNDFVVKHPVQYTFSWTVFAHNYVSKQIGKPQMTEEQARARWA